MPSPIPLTDQIACVTREILMRKRVYPGLVRQGTMPQALVDHEVACMQAVLATLEYLNARRADGGPVAPREELKP